MIQALFIMGGNSKNSDEIREKSTRAILVTQAVNDLGYSILASNLQTLPANGTQEPVADQNPFNPADQYDAREISTKCMPGALTAKI